jgi:hypothetical protein
VFQLRLPRYRTVAPRALGRIAGLSLWELLMATIGRRCCCRRAWLRRFVAILERVTVFLGTFACNLLAAHSLYLMRSPFLGLADFRLLSPAYHRDYLNGDLVDGVRPVLRATLSAKEGL